MDKEKKLYLAIALISACFFGVFWFLWVKFADTAGHMPTEAMPTNKARIGILQMTAALDSNVKGFKDQLSELGYKEDSTVEYITRRPEGDLSLLKSMSKELATLKPDLIFVNTSPATAALKELTKDGRIPIVFSMVSDPLGAGFVKNVQTSGNNLTGTSCSYKDTTLKRLELLKEAFPSVKKILIYYRPADLSGGPCANAIIENSSLFGFSTTAIEIGDKDDILFHLSQIAKGQYDAIVDPGDPLVSSVSPKIIDRSFELGVPFFALSQDEVSQGAAIGYGVDNYDLGRQSAMIASQILKGASPLDIPFELPRRWLIGANIAAIKRLGLILPESFLNKADYIYDDE